MLEGINNYKIKCMENKYEYHNGDAIIQSSKAVPVNTSKNQESPFIAAAGVVLAVGTGVLRVIGKGIVGATKLLLNAKVPEKRSRLTGDGEFDQLNKPVDQIKTPEEL